MNYDDFQPVTIEQFMGLMTNVRPISVPPSYSPDCKNNAFAPGSVRQRPGTITKINLAGGTDIYRGELFTRASPFTKYYLLLMDDNKLYQATTGARGLVVAPTGTPTSFRHAPYYDRAYLAFGNGLAGVAAMYVWSPAGAYCDLCTVAPAAIGAMAAADGATGAPGLDLGTHLIRVVFETRTGFRSSPTTGQVSYVAPGAKKVNLTNIPVHTTTGVVTKRHIVMTAAGLQTYYLAATIDDNTTTSLTMDVEDAVLELLTSITNYFQYQSPLWGVMQLFIYKDRMVMIGDGSDSSLAHVSEIDNCETFRNDVGFLLVNRDDGQRLTNGFTMRGILYLVKERSMYATEDNGDHPNTWPLQLVSTAVGTPSAAGIAANAAEEFAVILDAKGLYLFTGSPSEKVSEPIQTTWDTINQNYLHTGEVHIDSVNKRVYCLVPTGEATRPDKVLVWDYSSGFDKGKWDIWEPAGAAWRSLIVDGAETVVCAASPLVRKFDGAAYDDNGSAIDWYYRLGSIGEPKGLTLFGGLTAHAIGSGNLVLKVYGPDGTLLVTPSPWTLAAAPEKDLQRGLNIRREKIFVQFGINTAGKYGVVNKVVVHTQPDGERCY